MSQWWHAAALQYGVTRHRLRDILTEGDRWDIVHICGHGEPPAS